MAWRGWKAPVGRDADQQQQPCIDASRHGQDRAVLRQHRVERDQRFTVSARKRAVLGTISEARKFDGRRQRGQFGPELTIDKDDARRVDTRQAGKQ